MLCEEGVWLNALERVWGKLGLIRQPEKGVRDLDSSMDTALLKQRSDPDVFPVADLDHPLDAICHCDHCGRLDLGLFGFLKLLLKHDKEGGSNSLHRG